MKKLLQKTLVAIFLTNAFIIDAQTWSQQNVNQPNPQNIYTISMVSDQIGYLGGAGGYLKSTTNGGVTWTSQTLGASMQINSSSFVSATTGWMVGGGGGVYNTTNSGSTWAAQTSGITNHLYGIDMVSATTGWAAGAAGKVIKTVDGGTTWTAQTSGITTDLRSIDAISTTTAWITGAADVIKKTTDGGSTWTTLTSGTTGVTFVDIFFIDANTGWVVGTSGTIKKTTNGGSSWTAQTSGTAVTLRSVHFVSSTQGWAVGDNGTILTTTNGGTTWTSQTSSTTETLHSVYMVSSTQGWAAGNAARVVVYCSAPPQPGAISGSTTVCASSSETYSITPVAGAISYIWTLPNGWTGNSITNSITTTTGTTGGNITVKAVNGGCQSATQSLLTTVISAPATPGNITGNNSVCIGTSQTYSVATVAGATSYTWTLPSGWTGTSTTNSITTTIGGSTGSVVISVKANGCGASSGQRNLAVTVSGVPPTPSTISGSQTICTGASNLTYSISSIAGATSYTWTLPNGWTGSSTTNAITATAGSNSGNISIIANNTCGSSSATTLAVTVNSTPSAPSAISGSTTVCSGISQTYSTIAIPGVTSYTWTLPNGWTGSSTTNSITATTGSTGGTISVTATNSCGTSSPATLAVTISGSGSAPASPASITGNNTICSGTTQTYTAATVAGASSYSWTLPAGWTGSSTTNTITVTVGNTGGTITASANNTCGSSAPTSFSVSVNSIPATPGTITGITSVCSGSMGTYSITNVVGATSYNWSLPASWSGASNTNAIYATAGATGGTITVTATNTCGTSSASILTVTVKPMPNNAVTVNSNTITATQTNANYQWLNCANNYSTIAGATSQSYTATNNGNYSVEINLNGCIDTSVCSNIMNVGISGKNIISLTNIYPNPNNGNFNIEFSPKIENGNLEIINTLGQTIHSSLIQNENRININLNTEKGIYFVKIINKENNTIEIVKFIKQ